MDTKALERWIYRFASRWIHPFGFHFPHRRNPAARPAMIARFRSERPRWERVRKELARRGFVGIEDYGLPVLFEEETGLCVPCHRRRARAAAKSDGRQRELALG